MRRAPRREARTARPRRAAPFVALAAMVLGSAVALGGCSSAGQRPWTEIGMPPGAAPVTLTAYGEGILVGTQATDQTQAPGLLLLSGTEHVAGSVAGSEAQILPVTPYSPYAKVARWLSVEAEADGSLVAVAGARGGAHANVRWTVWRGAPGQGLQEQEQPFSVFGGWGAGELYGVALTGAGPMLLGSWESAKAGLDADIWLPDGARWVRQDPVGTALESTAEALVGPVSIAPDGLGALVSGSVLLLREGTVRQVPAVWRSERGNSGWTRIDLPEAGSSGEALGAVCAGGECTVAGRADGRLAVWQVAATGARRLPGVPEIAMDDKAAGPAPILLDGRPVLLVTDGAATRVVRQTAVGWVGEAGPPGVARDLAGVRSTLYAATVTEAGPTVWSAPLGE